MNSLYTVNYSDLTRNPSRPSSKSNTEIVFVRVVDIIMDDTHPEWSKYGKTDSVGVIKYKNITKDIPEDNPQVLPAAYPIHTSLKYFPLKNEIVGLVNAPDPDLNVSSVSRKTYYQTVVNLWNHPNHNAYPQSTATDVDLGNNIRENLEVNPLQPFPGDTLIEGRLGQSFRLSGNPSPKSTLTQPGGPVILISNGRSAKENPFDLTLEDINEDKSSIWLTSDHIVPITLANNKRDSFKNPPVKAEEYRGSGIFFNSDRITLNAKRDSILISGKDSVALSGKRVHVDGNDEIVLDASKIFLGKDSFKASETSREPVLKGNSVESYLEQLIDSLSDLARDLSTCKTIDGKPIPILNTRGPQLLGTLKALNNLTNPNGPSKLKSTTTYTE